MNDYARLICPNLKQLFQLKDPGQPGVPLELAQQHVALEVNPRREGTLAIDHVLVPTLTLNHVLVR